MPGEPPERVPGKVPLRSFGHEPGEALAKGQAMADTPKPAGKATDGNKTITKEEFENMGYTDRLKVFEENPELYKKYTE